MTEKRKSYRVRNIKSIRIIVETEEGKEEFATKKPCAMIASTLETGGKAPIKGDIQFLGKESDVLFAYYMLTKQLIEAFGDKLVLKIFIHLFSKQFEEMAKMKEMIALSRKDGKQVIH